MRPVPAFSTDLFYQGDFRYDDLLEVGNALGVSDLKYITTATLKPERVFYHACLNGIQTYIKLNHIGEVERAQEIADIADDMAEALRAQFMQNLTAAEPRLHKCSEETRRFCEKLHEIEGGKKWDQVRYDNSWNVNDYPPRWQKKAIETYKLIRTRMEKGEYTPSAGWDAGRLTEYWSLRNLEYKHSRDVARLLIEDYINAHFCEEQLLTMRPTTEREVTLFAGAMGSGKSALTRAYLQSLPEETRNDVVLNDADYLKFAIYRSVVRDGFLPKDHKYMGQEVQAESSNALYEGTRKRAYLARQKFAAPNAIVNSIVLGIFETQEGIASGGKVVAHHLYIAPEEAVIESEKRRAELGRAPTEADIRWSTIASAKSLLLLTQPQYKDTNITTHLYHRKAAQAPQHYATIDSSNMTLYVEDGAMLSALSQSACDDKSKQAALGEFLRLFANAGFSVVLVEKDDPSTVIAEYRNAELSILDREAFHTQRLIGEAMQALATGVSTSHSPVIIPEGGRLCR